MVRVFIVGVGMTKFEKPGKRDDDYPELAKEAIDKALKDCNVKFTEVQQAFAAFVYADSTAGQRAIYEVGMTGIPIINVNNYCASGATALFMGREAILSGRYDCVLAVGFEKMKPGRLPVQFKDRAQPLEKYIKLMKERVGLTQTPIAAQLFGNAGLEHMKKYGTRLEHFAKIAYKNHKHSINNPNAQFREEYTLEEILKSPTIYGPLSKLQCCPTSDGGAAAILVSENFVKSHGLEAQAIEILGMEMTSDRPSTFDGSMMNLVGYDMTKIAAAELFRKTNLTPDEVQVMEVHDCFSSNELITYEALGLCPPGKAGELIDRGDNTYGGKYVVNPSGGLISKGHPLGATGIAQCAELCWQLRNEAGPRQVHRAKLALQHNFSLPGAITVALYAHGFPSHQKNNFGLQTVSIATGENNFKVARYLRILEQAMHIGDDNMTENCKGIYGIRVRNDSGEEGNWVINSKVGRVMLEFNSKVKPESTFILSDDDAVDVILGKLHPLQAFYQGKFNVQGNLAVALKLRELKEKAFEKLGVIRAKL